MRTTLDLDDDVLASAKEIARREHKTAGQVVSELARLALTREATTREASARKPTVAGFAPFGSRGNVVSNELIRKLRDEGEY